MSFYSDTLSHLYAVANAAFVTREPADQSRAEEYGGRHRTNAAATADPEVIASTADAPALRALEQLRAWLNLSYDQLGRIVGLSPSVIHHWRRRHRENHPVRPRASSVERLWRVHASLRAIAEAIDGDDSGYGVQMWARSEQHGTTPLDLLLQGDIDEVEHRAGQLLFDGSARRPSAWRLVSPEVDDEAGGALAARTPAVDYKDADFG